MIETAPPPRATHDPVKVSIWFGVLAVPGILHWTLRWLAPLWYAQSPNRETEAQLIYALAVSTGACGVACLMGLLVQLPWRLQIGNFLLNGTPILQWVIVSLAATPTY